MKKFIFILCLVFTINAYAIPPSGDTFKVKSDASDTSPGYLDAKLAAGVGGNILIEDDYDLLFGTSSNYWGTYNTSGTEFDFLTTNADGGGTDGIIFKVEDGTDDVDFTGNIGGVGYTFESGAITKNQNGQTLLTITNTTDGTDAAPGVQCTDGVSSFYFAAYSDSFTTIPAAGGRAGLLSVANTNGAIFYNTLGGNTCFGQGTDLPAGNFYEFQTDANAELNDTNGEQSFLSVQGKINQTSTAAYNGLEVLMTETATGDGTSGDGNNLIKAGTDSDDDMFMVKNTGSVLCGPVASDGYVELVSGSSVPAANDNWRIAQDGDNLVFQRRESGSWVTKDTITP